MSRLSLDAVLSRLPGALHNALKFGNTLLLPMALAIISSCSGGGGEQAIDLELNDDPIRLASKDAVVRELRIVNYFVSYGDGEKQPQSSAAMFRSRAGTASSGSITLKSGAGHCESGSQSTEEGVKQRLFVHFSTSQEVDYSIGVASKCRTTNNPGVDAIVYDGTLESGTTSSESFDYTVAGLDGNSAEITIEQAGATFHQSLEGTIEMRHGNTSDEERQSVTYKFEHDLGSAIVGEFGRTGQPFIKIDGNGRFTVSGPYRYTSTECPGGSLQVFTDSPVTITRGFPSGGVLRFTSGNDTTSVSIASDGSATIRFGNGETAFLSSAELREIYSDFDTDCIKPRFNN